MHELVVAYIEWREESTAVQQVYAWWAGTGAEDAARAHAVYCAALDREEAAATVYAKLTEAAGQLLETELNPASLKRGALCR